MAITIKAPSETFEGKRAGVQFRKGVAVFEDEAVGRRVAESCGYEIVETEKPKADKEDEPEKETVGRGRKKAE